MSSKHQLKILSYNIHKGFSFTRQFVLERIRESIRSVHADIVFLQEVLGDHNGHAKKVNGWRGAQFEFLADQMWPHFAYGKNAIYDAGHHGNAILSKYPITSWENIDISNNRFERRGILHATIPWHDSPLHLLNVHLDLTERGRSQQIARIIERIKSKIPENERIILAGDFNDWRGAATPKFYSTLELTEVFMQVHGAHVKSFPSPFPFLTLDRVYVRGFSADVAKGHTGAPWSEMSDHCAIETHLTIK